MMERKATSSAKKGGKQDSHALNVHTVIINYLHKHEKRNFHATTYHVMYLIPWRKYYFCYYTRQWGNITWNAT